MNGVIINLASAMTREFIYTPKFDKEWRKLGLTDDNLRPLELFLLDNPDTGVIMRGTGGIRKMRWVLPEKGKSSGVRVLYIDFIKVEKICMFDLFPKYEKENLSQSERSTLRQIVKAIEEEFKK